MQFYVFVVINKESSLREATNGCIMRSARKQSSIILLSFLLLNWKKRSLDVANISLFAKGAPERTTKRMENCAPEEICC